MKTLLIIVGAALLLGGIALTGNFRSGEPGLLSRGPIHWHPQLTISVKGEPIEIPANVGIGSQYSSLIGYDSRMGMVAMHTHTDMPIIHLEFMTGPVHQSDVTVGRFFEVWGKGMRSFGTDMRMSVNGEDNTQFEQYVMHDGDVIELRFD